MNKKWRLLLLMQDGWDYELEKEAQHKEHYTEFVNRLLVHIDPVDYKKLLLIGACYTELELLEKIGFDVTGIGIAKKTRDGVRYFLMDMHDIKLPPGCFDCVSYHASFEHGMSVWLMVAEARRVLRLAGRVYMDMPFWDEINVEGDFTGMNRFHSNFLHPNQLKHVFRDLGFALIGNGDLHDSKDWYVFEKLSVENCANPLIKPIMIYDQINEPFEEITREVV